ncbi:MAG: hypothetical protein KBC73_25635 [Burkholderiaceae bacterium]|nr:hypothetical protein [Burkholderiaceae bacterium]
MFHPLIRLLASQPQLAARHVGAYADLAAAQAADAAQGLRQRLAWALAALAAAVGGSLMAGTALLLLAVVPLNQMPAPWLLAAGPALPLGLALLCWLQMRRRPVAWSLQPLREQLAADLDLLDEAGR